jgi:hypothetical protein
MIFYIIRASHGWYRLLGVKTIYLIKKNNTKYLMLTIINDIDTKFPLSLMIINLYKNIYEIQK